MPPDQPHARTSRRIRRRHQRQEQLRRRTSLPTRAARGNSKAQKGFAPYRIEHADLIASIRDGKPLNEAQNIAESTMTGILGREACYSGQEVTWDDAMKSTIPLGPKKSNSARTKSKPSPNRVRITFAELRCSNCDSCVAAELRTSCRTGEFRDAANSRRHRYAQITQLLSRSNVSPEQSIRYLRSKSG